jgi:predicted metalloprotease with PDZ domain
MEHRNSTVMTSPGSIAYARLELLGTVAHEFFHGWNVERIRPRDIEPFDLERTNASGDLWLAEGFTEYYGPLMLERAGLVDPSYLGETLRSLVEPVVLSTGRVMRSAEEMSRMAPFTDGGAAIDRTNWSFSVISYYQQGGAIALALDLTLRDRSNGQLSLDDFMRAMWQRYGKPGGAREGYVDRPYTTADVEATLADVSGDRAFAHDFVARYIQGHEAADYSRLLALGGFAVRRTNKGRAWMGDVRFDSRGGVARVADLVAPNWPAYAAGLDDRDEVRQLAGQRTASADDVSAVLRRQKPGDRVAIVFVDRNGVTKTGTITLGEDPHLDIVPVESGGGALTATQRVFRDRWLEPQRQEFTRQ